MVYTSIFLVVWCQQLGNEHEKFSWLTLYGPHVDYPAFLYYNLNYDSEKLSLETIDSPQIFFLENLSFHPWNWYIIFGGSYVLGDKVHISGTIDI